MKHTMHLSPLLLLCLHCIFSVSGADELQILLNLTNSIQSPNKDLFNSWSPDNNLCQFSGITCNLNQSVTEIDLSNQRLTGVLPLDSICNLQFLEKLAFGYNQLNGTISKDLNRCVRLRYLDLGNNFFSGSFPDISLLSELRYLYLNNSRFSGTFPRGSLKNMTNLIALSVGDNTFDRTPFPPEILNLYDLDWLYMSNCGIEGVIPAAIGKLTKLRNLELSDNFLTGELPPELGNLVNLWQLQLYSNNFSGKLPIGLRNLTKLEYFDASFNRIEGDLSELMFLTNIVSLQLFSNGFSGQVPPEMGEFKKLVNLSLYRNALTGPLPQKLGSWAQFDFIDVSENRLTGPIPPDMCKQGTMKKLLMLQNQFTGEIPANYANCKTLISFRVSNNSLSGVVPAGIWGLPKVIIIDIFTNQLEGEITPDIKNAGALGQVLVGNNRLSGELPKEISKAESLVSIDFRNNRFSGKIPPGIGELKKLSSLYLQNNMFSGPIPEVFGSLSSLSELNMAHNLISGQIPSSLGELPTLNSLNLSDNKLAGQIPSTLSSLRLSLLDLSNNKLTGRIPEALAIDAYNGSFAGNPGLCSPTISSFQLCRSNHSMPKFVHAFIICLGIILGVLLASFVFFFFLKRKEKKQEHFLKGENWDVKSFHVLSFTEDEILNSIKQENLIGKGGSGNVYKVVLPNGTELAVKHFWNTDSSARKKSHSSSPMLERRRVKSREFNSEVQTLSSIRHVNVVKLYSTITNEDSSLLVYEYLPNGSLWDRLHTPQKSELNWEMRYDIALGAAKGLEYLHHGFERPIIHRDVKSSNILLDEFLKPRIADFGLAKIIQEHSAMESTQVIAGTHGYIAPEYGYTNRINEKSDVYSFGVVLMELVSGRRPIEPEYGENEDIVKWVYSNLRTRESIMGIVDPEIPEDFKEEAAKVLRVALLCTRTLPSSRPTMRKVVQMLENAGPTKPFGFVGERVGSSKMSLETDSGSI